MAHREKDVYSNGQNTARIEEKQTGRNTFSKESRILKRSEFLRLSQKNRKVFNKHFLALFDKGINGQTRLGITVTKRVGNAVVRNQLKRYVREFFRKNRQRMKSGIDVNIIIKKEASGIPSKEAYLSLQSIFSRIRI
jgi:ribonuclease P protein component